MSYEDTQFIESSRNQYPYRMLHIADCGAAKRVKYPTYKTFEEAATDQQSHYYGTEWHEGCIKDGGDLYKAILVRANRIRETRMAAERRVGVLEVWAVAQVVVNKMAAEAGPLSDEEKALLTEYVEGVTNGDFRPRVRDLREIAIKPVSY